MLGGLEGFLENTVEHRAGPVLRERGVVGGLHLTEDFRLTDHLRIEPGRDGEQVGDGLVIKPLETGSVELRGGAAGRFAERGVQLGDRPGGVRHPVELDPVAGVEQRELLHPRQCPQLRGQRGGAGFVQRKFFADGQRRRAVAGAEEKEDGLGELHLQRWGRRGTWWCRLEFTGPSDSRARTNITRQTHAKRTATSRVRQRSSPMTR